MYTASVQSDGAAPCAADFVQACGALFWVHFRGRLLVPARLVPPLAFDPQTLSILACVRVSFSLAHGSGFLLKFQKFEHVISSMIAPFTEYMISINWRIMHMNENCKGC